MAPYHTIVHEAGHSVVARLLGLEALGYAQEEGYYASCVEHSPDPRVRKEVLAGGAAAEISMYGEILSSVRALRGDLEEFTSWHEFVAMAQRMAMKIDPEALRQEIEWARECFRWLSAREE